MINAILHWILATIKERIMPLVMVSLCVGVIFLVVSFIWSNYIISNLSYEEKSNFSLSGQFELSNTDEKTVRANTQEQEKIMIYTLRIVMIGLMLVSWTLISYLIKLCCKDYVICSICGIGIWDIFICWITEQLTIILIVSTVCFIVTIGLIHNISFRHLILGVMLFTLPPTIFHLIGFWRDLYGLSGC